VSYGLLAFTSGGCFLINGGGPTEPITPETISVTQQASPGANSLQPLTVNYDVVFGADKGNRLFSAGFAWEKQSYVVKDITQLAPHLFDGHTTVDWTWAESPFKALWVVRDDGKLLCCTYVPEEDVYAWSRHDTQGLFKSITSVPEREENAVYVIVQRHIPATDDEDACWVSYIERFAERDACCLTNAWYLDSALSLPKCYTDTTLYLSGTTGTVSIYTYDPCNDAPSGDLGDCAVTGEFALTFDSDPFNFVTDTNGGGGVNGAGGADSNLTQYVLFTENEDRLAAVDRDNVTLWEVTQEDVRQMFEDLGADTGGQIYTYSVILSPVGDYLLFYLQTVTGPGSTVQMFVGIADIPATGVVAPPILLNYLKMKTAVNRFTCTGFYAQYDAVGALVGMVMATQDFSTSRIQFWLMPTPAQLIAGTYRGNHPGCAGTLDADQGPSVNTAWTNAQALLALSSGTTVQDGTVGGNSIGTFLSLNDGGLKYRWYMFVPKAWLDAPTSSGINATYRDIYPDGAILYLDLTPYGIYASTTWSGVTITKSNTYSTVATDVTSTTLYDSAGSVGDFPWTDEYTRIYDAGANEGWLASYRGRPAVVQDGLNVYLLFAIMDGNPDYSALIGTGQRVYYARVRAYRWDTTSGIFKSVGEQEGIILRNGDLGYSGWNFNAPNSQVPLLVDGDLYFQVNIASNARTALLRFGTFSPEASAAGEVIVIGCGKIQINEVISPSEMLGTVIAPLDVTLPDDPDGTPIPITGGMWYIVSPTQVVSGLDHLEGKEVYALADGSVVGPLTVAGGEVDLGSVVSSAVVGLRYTQQIKTLYLTAEGINKGTEQGKRKKVNGVSLRVECTQGPSAGVITYEGNSSTGAGDVVPVPDLVPAIFTGDARVNTYGQWRKYGEIFIEQTLPLPANILGVIVEVTAGDTGQ
jgi:hypothetical protein